LVHETYIFLLNFINNGGKDKFYAVQFQGIDYVRRNRRVLAALAVILWADLGGGDTPLLQDLVLMV